MNLERNQKYKTGQIKVIWSFFMVSMGEHLIFLYNLYTILPVQKW